MPAGLFGLDKWRTNRDFSVEENWGKNIFTNAFPVALCCYMHDKGLLSDYIELYDAGPKLMTRHRPIPLADVLGCDPATARFLFEECFSAYRGLCPTGIDKADVVVTDASGTHCRSLEIKLTVVPDNTTRRKPRDGQASEMVIRRPPIAYLALGIASKFPSPSDRSRLLGLLDIGDVNYLNWVDAQAVSPFVSKMADALDRLLRDDLSLQEPLIVQPVWRSVDTSLELDAECFDVFVWSDYAVTRLFVDAVRESPSPRGTIDRLERTVVWIVKMLRDYATAGTMNPLETTNQYTYGTKNDKACSIPGGKMLRYMASPHLTHPRVGRNEVKDIVLGGGERLLSPERRLDAAVQAMLRY